MAYNSDTSKVTEMTGDPYTVGSQPTLAQVLDMLSRRYAEINGVLKARGYTVPATGSNDVAMLAHYEAMGAAVLAWDARYHSSQDFPNVKRWSEEYQNFLARLRRGEQDLVDQVSAGDDEPYFEIGRAIRRDDYTLQPLEDEEEIS